MPLSRSDIERLAAAQRINVVGVSGSGKSTLARSLSRALELPYVELDELFWKPNWEESQDEEFLPRVKAIADTDRWVIDGNYSRTHTIKWSRAHAVVWIDLNLLNTLWRVTKRTLTRSWRNEVLWAGNRESFTKGFFSRDSVILWSLTSHARVRKAYGQAVHAKRYGHIHFIHLTSQKEIDSLVEGLTSQ